METTGNPAWDDLRVLLAIHRDGSFLKAGRTLGLSTSTTGRRIAALEQALGRRLVVKTSAGTQVEAGAMELVELAEQVERGLNETRRRAETLAGVVRVSSAEGFAGPLIAPLAALRRRSPELHIELLSEQRVVDLTRREAELGVRTARSQSAVLVEKRLGDVPFALYGSRAFLERRARATSLTRAELGRLDFVGLSERMAGLPQAKWARALGATRFVFRVSSDALLADVVREGLGLGVLPVPLGDADATLQRLEVDLPAPRLPVWLALHRDLRNVPRVRAVADAITAAFKVRLPR